MYEAVYGKCFALICHLQWLVICTSSCFILHSFFCFVIGIWCAESDFHHNKHISISFFIMDTKCCRHSFPCIHMFINHHSLSIAFSYKPRLNVHKNSKRIKFLWKYIHRVCETEYFHPEQFWSKSTFYFTTKLCTFWFLTSELTLIVHYSSELTL